VVPHDTPADPVPDPVDAADAIDALDITLNRDDPRADENKERRAANWYRLGAVLTPLAGVSIAATITLSQDVWSLPPSVARFAILTFSLHISAKCDRYASTFSVEEVHARRRRSSISNSNTP
jgi:hypothetical protein